MVSLAIPQSALQGWLQPERSVQLARVVNVLLVVWLAWLLASLSWMVLPEPEPTPLVAQQPAKPPQIQRQQSQIDERHIAGWHLFGVAGEEKPSKPAATVDAPDTRLKLTLRGLFASDNSDGARAIIGDPRGKEEPYSVGDPVPGGAKISEIHTDRVILERNGRYETLRLPKQRSSLGAGRSSSTVGSRAVSSTGQAAAFTKYRSEIKRNPSAFLNYVRATPARQGGKFIGFRLQAGKKRGALKELGLKAGDIVTAINGVQIDSPAKGMKAMQALGEGENVNVTLLRSGQEVSLSLALPSEQ